MVADELEQKVLSCEWSDYAHDKMVFQAKLDVYGMEADTWDGVDQRSLGVYSFFELEKLIYEMMNAV